MPKANPGGHIAPEHVYGRKKLIQSIWDRIEQQCVLINAERRIGKTCVIKKMVAAPKDGWFPVFQDLEKIRSPEEFAREVFEVVKRFLSKWTLMAREAQRLYDEHDFGQVTKKRRPWKRLLEQSVRDLMSQSDKTEQRLILFWDEVPFMIDNIRQSSGEPAASEVLDTLRSLRQEHPDLRMVFTGSVGLHHVLANINEAHIASAPVNDMYPIEVTPLAPADAAELAMALLDGEGVKTSDADVAGAAIADEVDSFPFYIHHVVSGLKMDGLPAEPETIAELVARHLVDANDPWELAHFRTRIPIYYKAPGDAKLVHLILDQLAAGQEPHSVSAVQAAVNSQTNEFDDRERLLRTLRLMERDHYLSRDPDGRYQFRFPLVRRWWKLDRGL